MHFNDQLDHALEESRGCTPPPPRFGWVLAQFSSFFGLFIHPVGVLNGLLPAPRGSDPDPIPEKWVEHIPTVILRGVTPLWAL